MPRNQESKSKSQGLPAEFFTVASFGTLSGCVIIAGILTTAICKAFKSSPDYTGFVISVLIALLAVYFSKKKNFSNYVIACINGCLIYLTLVGASSYSPYANPNTAEDPSQAGVIRPWVQDKNLVNATKQQKEQITQLNGRIKQKDQALRNKDSAIQNIETSFNNISQIVAKAPGLSKQQIQVLRENLASGNKSIAAARR